VIPLGLLFSEYNGPASWWLNNPGASLCYEVFFILLGFTVWPTNTAASRIPVAVLWATVALEMLQLWQPPILVAVRATWLGRAVLGNTFAWSDLPAYPVGCFLGWLLLRRFVGATPGD